jgi:hypothetical protein
MTEGIGSLENDKTRAIELSYEILQGLDMQNSKVAEEFQECFGVNEIESEVLYYFLLSVFGLISESNIRVRIDLQKV